MVFEVAGRDQRRGRGGLAHEVLAALEGAGGPLTPAQVLERLGADLAYTTVMTVMVRLRDKGVLARVRSGRTYSYSLLQDPARVTARGMHRLLDVQPDRATALARFVDDLSAADEQVLRDLLAGEATGTVDESTAGGGR
jgi:predicted transcriptional regulator